MISGSITELYTANAVRIPSSDLALEYAYQLATGLCLSPLVFSFDA
jgi:hypothetical protein